LLQFGKKLGISGVDIKAILEENEIELSGDSETWA
jgi:hypothetical protein